MNQKIKSILQQSGLQPYYDAQEGDIEKFAELLLKECIDLLPEDCQSKNGCHTSWVIKEHFGIS